MAIISPTPPRRRGAQRGNLNALKHAVTSLTRLIMVQQYIARTAGNDEMAQSLKQALKELGQEWNLSGNNPPATR
jgi:hypothetical protein